MRWTRWIVGCSLGLGAAGCTELTELEPAEDADTVGDVAEASIAGVRVQAGGRWPGGPGVRDDVTPLELTVINGSNFPLQVRYSNFMLRGAQGEYFSALPPFRIKGSAEKYVLSTDYGPISPSFAYRGFEVWGPYGDFYPSVPSDQRYEIDPSYYDIHYPYWERVSVPMPTKEMLDWALPEGVLQPGGNLTGFLYFEHVPEKVEKVELAVAVVDAKTGERKGTVAIPFDVR
ncbi:MAG: hypothetical protein HOW73_38920 [Polyangiaceae bacterium]|nr:hypothetical protein [Polyangiaceae bacterium]